MPLYIIRHGETSWNLEKRKQGHLDSPLTVKGINQAKKITELLKFENIDWDKAALYVSPLFRTRQYSQIIIEGLNLNKKPTIEYSIREHAFGDWEGLTDKEIEEKFPGEIQKRKNDWWNYVIPGGGESYEILNQRIKQFLNNHYINAQNQQVILICHEMVSKVTRKHLLSLTTEEALKLDHPQDTIYKITSNELTEIR